jgi:hypothetical protein
MAYEEKPGMMMKKTMEMELTTAAKYTLKSSQFYQPPPAALLNHVLIFISCIVFT